MTTISPVKKHSGISAPRPSFMERVASLARKDCESCGGKGMYFSQPPQFPKASGAFIFCGCIPNAGRLWPIVDYQGLKVRFPASGWKR